MSYYQENRPAMGGLADALAMQGRRGDSTLVHMNPMEVRMLETMSPDGRLSINPETGLPEAFKLKDIAAFALPIAASIAFPMLAPAGLSAALGGVGTAALGAGLGGFGAGLIQGKGVGDSLIQGGLSGLMSYGLGSAFAPAAPGANIPTAAAPVTGLSGADQAAVGSTFDPMMEAVAGLPAAPEPTGFFGRIGNSVTDAAQKPFMQETLSSIAPESYAKAVTAGAAPTYGSALTAGGSGLLSSALLAPEEMPYDIAGMDDMDAYYASRVPDLEAGRRRGRAAARGLNYPPSGSTGSQYYGMATSPGGFGTFYAADGGQVPGALGDLPPHVARGLMENPEIGTDAAAFSNLVNSQPSPKNLMGQVGGALGNYPPHIARAIMQNPQIVNDVNALSNLVNTQPSTKDLIGSSSFFKGLPPHVARGVMQNPEVLNDATAFSNLVTGKASGIQTDQISNLAAGRLRGQAAARSLNYPLSGGSAADYYRMATSPGGFGTFYAADGGRVPTDLNINGEPHQLSYINQEEADLLRSMGGSGQNVYGIPAYYDASNDGGDAAGPAGGGVGDSNDGGDAAGPAGGGVGASNDGGDAAGPAGVSDMGVGGYSDAQAPISAPPPDIGMLGRGVMGLFGLSPKGFTVNPDLSYSQTMGIGVPGIGTAVANAMGIDTSLGTVTGPTTSPGGGDIGDDDGGVGDAGGDSGVYGRPYGDPYNTKKVQAPTAPAPSPVGPTALRFLSLTAPRTAGDIYNAATTGGIPRFFTGMAQGGGISSLAYGGEAAPVGFANKAFEGMVPGQGTGMSDDIPFSIEGNQPALLSRDEYVLPADVVSQLGDGSSSAGADMLDNFISQVRQTKYGNTQQPAPVGPQLMTGLMRQGGTV
jgi:hypothetical protein